MRHLHAHTRLIFGLAKLKMPCHAARNFGLRPMLSKQLPGAGLVALRQMELDLLAPSVFRAVGPEQPLH